MAASMDFYNRTTLKSDADPFSGGELMEVLEPFMKTSPPSTPSQSSSPFSNSYLPSSSSTSPSPNSFFQVQPSSSSSSSFPIQPNFYTDGCSTMMPYLFPSGLSPSQSPNNYIGFEQPSSVLGLNQLTPSQISQIQTQIHFKAQQNSNPLNNALSFLAPKPVPMKQSGTPPKPTNLYRGVRQRHWGKWVAEIRLPKKRTRLCRCSSG